MFSMQSLMWGKIHGSIFHQLIRAGDKIGANFLLVKFSSCVVHYYNIIMQHYFNYCNGAHLQYVEDPRFEKLSMDPVTVLHQAAKGLAFLHSIGISKLLMLCINP